jgi:ATP-binding cassette subfamily B protein
MQLPNSISQFLWHFIKKQPWPFTGLVITNLIWCLNETSFPYFIKLIVDGITSFKGNRAEIYSVIGWPLGLLITMWGLMEIAMRVQGFLFVYTFPRFKANIRRAVYDYIKEHSHSYFSNNFAGSLSTKIWDLPHGSENILDIFLFNFFSITLSFCISVFLLWKANIIFAGLMLIWFTAHMMILFVFLQKGHKLAVEHSESVSTLSGKLIDSVTNISNIRLFARGSYEVEYLQSYQEDEISKSTRAGSYLEKMKILHGLAGSGWLMSVIILLVYGWSNGWVSVGDFSLVIMLSSTMLGLIWHMSHYITKFINETGRIRAALSIVTATHSVQDIPGALPLKVDKGEIEFKKVTFSFKDRHFFQGLSVKIPAGQKVGLVGFSGSGKSTFVNLLLRLYDIQGGQILIDGQDISQTTQNSLRSHIAVIPQEPSLFHRSLLENIRYGRLDATDEEVMEASRLAHCQEFIKHLEGEYQAIVGERGSKLSGGQRQRIAIARAILKKAPILLMDEATSALDSLTEKYVQDSLEYLMKNTTTLVIAHRLSTLANMDRILVFQEGKIVEEGTIHSLLEAQGHFAKLWQTQHQEVLP